MKKLIVLAILALPFLGKAQYIEEFLKAGTEDASKLSEKYVNPMAKGFMYGLNNGWYTTARVHKKLGFDITIVANLAKVPTAEQTFEFVKNDFKTLTLKDGPATIQTAMGGKNTTKLEFTSPVGTVGSIELPDGIGEDLPMNAVPSATVQVGVGIPIINADLKVRYMPKVGFDDIKVGMIGVGIQKDITKMLKLKYTPFHLSVLAAFTQLKADYDIQEESNIKGSGQKLAYKVNAFTLQAIAGLNFKIIEFYGAVGYNNAKTDVDLLGSYEISNTETYNDPFTLNFKASGMRSTIGTRLNLAIFKIFADYTFQEYNTISAGIAFSFR